MIVQDPLLTSLKSYLGSRASPNEHELALYQKTQKYIRYIQWIPGLRMVAVVNSLSQYATHEDSDIDLLVITAQDRLWLVRVLMTGVFWILGVWRHGKDIRGNFCLSFFMTDTSLSLQPIAIENDIYLEYWIENLKPILIVGDIYTRFVEANRWVRWGYEERQENMRYCTLRKVEQKESPVFGKIFDWCEKYLKKYLLPRTYMHWIRLGKPEGVIISDTLLKFHDHDRREEIRDAIFTQREG